VLEKESSALGQKNTALEAENRQLRTKIQDFEAKTDELKKKIEFYNKPSHDELLKKPIVDILLCLASEEASSEEEIASEIGVNIQIVKYHIEELLELGIVVQEYNPLGANWWSLQQEGRRLLIANGLIS
jgi:DNA-binding MarR family transcriptional regulator